MPQTICNNPNEGKNLHCYLKQLITNMNTVPLNFNIYGKSFIASVNNLTWILYIRNAAVIIKTVLCISQSSYSQYVHTLTIVCLYSSTPVQYNEL